MSTEEKSMKPKDRLLLGAGILVTAILGLIIVVLYMIMINTSVYEALSLPQYFLPALLVTCVSCLIMALTVVAVILSALNLSDRTQALGLPKGSIRSLIALILILIFAIMSIHLYRNIGINYGYIVVNGTRVWGEIGPTDAQIDFAQQILTTIATLVVAVAGFYFGTRAVQVAQGKAEVATLRVLFPTSPTTLKKDDEGAEIIISLETTPEGEAIKGDKPEGDDDGKLELVKYNQFKYIQGKSPEDQVVLKFSLVKYPDVTQKLVVDPEK